VDELRYVAYCGLYCKLCSNVARIPKYARALRETLRKGSWEHFGEHEVRGFNQFWTVLEKLCRLDETILGCKEGCGPPGCKIKECAEKQGVLTCAFCSDFPCELVEELNRKYPIVIENLRRQKEIGVERWVEEQESLYRSGFCYDDVASE